jgi:hypothetical protein
MEGMTFMSPTVKQLAELAKEAAILDPIDWDKFKVTEEHVYEMMASNVLEQFHGVPEDQRLVVAMATITKLLVENFVLNVKLGRA